MAEEAEKKEKEAACPKCGSPLSDVITTKTGKSLRRCSTSIWNEETRQTEGCDYVEWLTVAPVELDEKCPKCGSALVMATTRFGKKLKRCSTNRWDPETKAATGCDFVEWQKGSQETLEEKCPSCGEALVLYTTATGKKLKKCSTNRWDPQTKTASGCDYIEWQS